MKRIAYMLFSLALLSCGVNNQEKEEIINANLKQKNELVITLEGDSLEHGLWKYNDESTGLSKEGEYKNGFKTGAWKYKMSNKEKLVEWTFFEKHGVKLNYPKYLKINKDIEYPTIFIGDILDSNNNTYIALLEYNLKSMSSSVYDYLYQVNEAFVDDTTRVVKGKSFRKYTFKNFDLFTINIQEEKNDSITYNIISQVFEVDGYLYDFTYKDIHEKMNSVNIEVFKDMLYSMECKGVDVFTYSTGQYLKVENVTFD